MGKRIVINLAVIAAVLGLLFGAWWLVRPVKTEDPDLADIYTEDDVITVFECDKAAIDSVSVKNPEGEYTLYKEIDGTWQLRGYEGAELSESLVEDLLYRVAKITSDVCVETNPKDLSKYGLDEPQASLTIRAGDREKTFYIGDKLIDSTAFYANADTSSDVYLFQETIVNSYIMMSGASYRRMQTTTIEEGDVSEVEIYEGNSLKLHIKVSDQGARDELGILSFWDLLVPYNRKASNEEVYNRVTQYISGIYPSQYFDYSEENMAAFGLSPAKYTVIVNGGELKYYIGDETDGAFRYVYKEGDDFIFAAEKYSLEFVNVTGYQLLEKYIALVHIKDFDSLRIVRGTSETVLSAKDPETDGAVYYYNGKVVSEDDFKDFYQVLLGMSVDGEAADVPDTKSVYASFEYTLYDDEHITVEFCDYNDRNYAVYIDGECQFMMLKKDLERVFNAMDKLAATVK